MSTPESSLEIPFFSSVHKTHSTPETGLLDHITTGQLIGDKGYIGLGMITPIRTQPKQQHTEEEKRFNKSVNAIRYMIERVIANLKTWRILHTDYRRPFTTFPETITTVAALEFYRNTF